MIKPYLELCRVSNLPTVWTNVLAAAVISGAGFSWPVYLMLAASMSLFYSGGMCLNDVCDIDIDRKQKPTRPIPSERISKKRASIITLIIFLIALSILLFLPFQRAIYLGILLLVLIVLYDTLHKNHSMSIVLMASCRLMIFIISSVAVTGSIIFSVVIAGSLQFLYTLLITFVARHENKRGKNYIYPVIPIMIACMSLLDGIILAVMNSYIWIIVGIAGAILTLTAQKYVSGD